MGIVLTASSMAGVGKGEPLDAKDLFWAMGSLMIWGWIYTNREN